ncbi:MAG: porphobilinogen deaminase [Bacteroidota bacterium]|jgi:porphobilinogen deaminase
MKNIRIGIPTDPLLATTMEPALVGLLATGVHVERIDLAPVGQHHADHGWDIACLEALSIGTVDACLRRLETLPVPAGDGWCIAALSDRTPPGFTLLVNPAAAAPAGRFHLPDHARILAELPAVAAQLLPLCPNAQLLGTRQVNWPPVGGRFPDGDAILLDNRCFPTPTTPPEPYTRFHPRELIPLPGQGVLAWLCRPRDLPVRTLLASVHRPAVARVTNVERRVSLLLASPDGSTCAYCIQDGEGHYHAHAAYRRAHQTTLAQHSQSTSAGLADALARRLRPTSTS